MHSCFTIIILRLLSSSWYYAFLLAWFSVSKRRVIIFCCDGHFSYRVCADSSFSIWWTDLNCKALHCDGDLKSILICWTKSGYNKEPHVHPCLHQHICSGILFFWLHHIWYSREFVCYCIVSVVFPCWPRGGSTVLAWEEFIFFEDEKCWFVCNYMGLEL